MTQFRVLYRTFLAQIVDLELLPSQSDPFRLMAQAAALLAALSCAITFALGMVYNETSPADIARFGWGHISFLIQTTMAVAGLVTVLAWDSILPSRRDALVLGNLPIRVVTLFRSKAAATATSLAIGVVAVNLFAGFIPIFQGGLRALAAYWIATIASAVFTFSTLLAAQGLAALVLPYRRYLQASNLLQIGGFFVILGAYFLTPGPAQIDTSHGVPPLLRALPCFWFVGMYQQLGGTPNPLFLPFASWGALAFVISAALGAGTYILAYAYLLRKMVEQPDLAPTHKPWFWTAGPLSRSRFPNRLGRWTSKAGIGIPARDRGPAVPQTEGFDSAIGAFLSRTLLRSRQHRNLLAIYIGLALALSLFYAKAMLFGNTESYEDVRRMGFEPPKWFEPNHALMIAGFVLMILAILGTRAAFSIPATLKANWIFHITAVHSPRMYFEAVRRAMFRMVVFPVAALAALFYIGVWGGFESVAHSLVVLAVGTITAQYALAGFVKMPFACSYIPGQGSMRTRLPAYAALFLFVVDVGTRIERFSFQSNARMILVGGILTTLVLTSRRKWKLAASAPHAQLQFEEEEVTEVAPLRLDAEHSPRTLKYLDVIAEPTLGQRAWSLARKVAIAHVCVLAAGFVYEGVSRWRNVLPPRQGQSIDIGGRTLNIHCAGTGSPTVIFESGLGSLGKYWTSIQSEVAKYTRACWYDRAGYGWSDPAPFPHPASAIADDLHKLLAGAAIAPPYVLAGHSFGGLCVRVYQHRYPRDVAGMVLSDSSHVDERETIDPPGGGWVPYNPAALPTLGRLLEPTGLIRLLQPGSVAGPFEPRTAVQVLKEQAEYESLLEARQVRDMGDIPLIVMTAGNHRLTPAENPVEARKQRRFEALNIEAQQQLARLSSRGEQRVFPQAHHNLPTERRQDVLDAIHDVVDRTIVLRRTIEPASRAVGR